MRIFLLGLMAVAAICMPASANVYVLWGADAGFYWNGDSSSLLGDASGNSALAQFIWSVDAVADPAVSFGSYVSGDDVLLQSKVITEDGISGNSDDYAFFDSLFDDGGVQPNGGYVYARIFQNDSPAVDNWYYVGPVVAASSKNPAAEPPDSPQIYQMNRDLVNGDAIDGTYSAQVVPEPGTFALFGLGAAVVALRRRRR